MLHLEALRGFQHDHSNEMSLHHGVQNAANLYMDGFANRNYRHMLFSGTVGFARVEQRHFFAAARKRSTLVEQLNGNVSAVSAFVEFEFHDIPPSFGTLPIHGLFGSELTSIPLLCYL